MATTGNGSKIDRLSQTPEFLKLDAFDSPDFEYLKNRILDFKMSKDQKFNIKKVKDVSLQEF